YRAKMSESFAEAIEKKDVSPIADHYTNDAIFAGLLPTQYVLVGREAIVKRYEGLFKAGTIVSYSSKPIEAHLMNENTAWTSGVYNVTLLNRDGTKQEFQGHWIDMLRREQDGVWRVNFAGYASMPKQ